MDPQALNKQLYPAESHFSTSHRCLLPVFKIEVWVFVEKNACFSRIRPRADLLVDALDEILAEDHLR